MIRRLLIGCMLASVAWLFPPTAHADTQCPYPGVGILSVNVVGIGGGFCDFPTEINGSHWHCQGGGINLGGSALLGGGSGGGVFGINPAGIGGVSCNWRCPDGVDAPAPNPPGMWKEYLVPMNSTNYCKDHMVPNGFWSAPVLPTEGIPPAGENPEQAQLPQPIPPPPPIMPEPQPPVAPLAPGEPNP